jgi:hypothetical protein
MISVILDTLDARDIRIHDIVNNKKTFLRNLKERIKEFIKIEKKNENISKTFEQLKEVPWTEFELVAVVFKLIYSTRNTTLYEVFDNVKLNKEIPFATFKIFFKIRKDFIPPDYWSALSDPYNDETFFVKVLNVEEIVQDIEKINKLFTTATFYMDGINFLNIDLEIKTPGKETKIIENLTKIFPPDLELIPIRKEQDRIKGISLFPEQSLNKYVMADLIMNDEILGNYLKIDEYEKATKNKPGVWIYFNDPAKPELGTLTANIIDRVARDGDEEIKNKSRALFPYGQKFIRVRISRAPNEKAVKNFLKILSRLITLYRDKYSKVVAFYNKYLGDEWLKFEKDSRPVKKKKKPKPTKEITNVKALQKVVPDLWIPNLSRKCGQLPKIIKEDEVDKYKEEGKQVMKFPREGPAQYYVCDIPNKPRYIYPGLYKNKQENRDKYPFFPCCYVANQENKKRYKDYFEKGTIVEEKRKEKDEKQQDVFKTHKFVPQYNFGDIPELLKTFFQLIDSQHTYYRIGVARSKSSFLTCILTAMSNKFVKLDDEDKPAQVVEERKHLTNKILAITRQEFYNLTPTEINEILKNPDRYIDPRRFIRLMEEHYKCNIYLFSREWDTVKMDLPRHLQNYYVNRKKRRPSVFVYTHIGSESDRAMYPQSELIVRWDKVTEFPDYKYPPGSEPSRTVVRLFNKLKASYNLDKIVKSRELPPALDIHSQAIDSYGKTRFLRVKFENKYINLLVEPIAPLNVVENSETEFLEVTDYKTAVKFASFVEKPLLWQNVVEGNKINEIKTKIGNVNCYIAINPTNIQPAIPKQSRNYVPRDEQSALELYNRNKKLARYITEYFYYVFSLYIRDKKITKITIQNIQNFIKSRVQIKENWVYKNIRNYFDMQNSLINNGKIILNSKELLTRLLFILRLALIQNYQNIIDYHKRIFMQNYYEDITDFKIYPSQVLLQGEDAVDKWITERYSDSRLYSNILLDKLSPYFFKNNLISDKIMLAQNAESLNEALEIAKGWKDKGYNMKNISFPEESNIDFILFNYINSKEIKPFLVKGSIRGDYIPKIIGYKVENETEIGYTVLLEL